MRAPSGYLLAARYRLVEQVGRGGMGTVWRARDELLDRDVAVKEVRLPLVLDEDLRAELCARTEREGRATAMVAHPSVITVFDVVTEDDRPWIVMELLKAQSLEEIVKRDGPLPPRRVADIGRQVLGALHAVHAKGILHRDVKPSNVLVTEDRAVLTDFGLAALEGDASITQAGIVLGSAGYIAPERVLGEKASPAADLWSLGATLYLAVEGHGLHGRGSAVASLAALTSGAPIPMEKAGPLAPVLRGLLQIDPHTRMDGMQAAMLLSRIAAGGTANEHPRYSTSCTSTNPRPPAPTAPTNAAPPARATPANPAPPATRTPENAAPPASSTSRNPTPPAASTPRNAAPPAASASRNPTPPALTAPANPAPPATRTPENAAPPTSSASRNPTPPAATAPANPAPPATSTPTNAAPPAPATPAVPRPAPRRGQHRASSRPPSAGAGGRPDQAQHSPRKPVRRPVQPDGPPDRSGRPAPPAVPAQRRRPTEGMHRKPSQPALAQVVTSPRMRWLAAVVKLLLPRRYWPPKFLR